MDNGAGYRAYAMGAALCALVMACGPDANPLLPRAPVIEGEPLSREAMVRQFDDRTSACDALCALTLLHCKQEKRAYPSFSMCMQQCPLIPSLGTPGDMSGDSVQCRLTYALLAEQTLTLWFCQNASATGGLQCR